MKIIIYSPMSSGSHWLARSLSKINKNPYTYESFQEWPNSDLICVWHKKWDSDEINKFNAKAIGLTRNPLDHLLSYMSLFNMPYENFIEAASSQEFRIQRKIAKTNPSEFTVSYDEMVNDKYSAENKIKSILNINDFSLELESESRKYIPEYVRFARSGYWREIFSDNDVDVICNILGEEIY